MTVTTNREGFQLWLGMWFVLADRNGLCVCEWCNRSNQILIRLECHTKLVPLGSPLGCA